MILSSSSFNALDGLSQLVIHTLEQVLVVRVRLRDFSEQFVLDPLLIDDDFLPVEVFNRRIDARHLRPFIELHSQVYNFAYVPLGLYLSFFSRP